MGGEQVPIPFEYQGDWSKIAKLIVHDALQTQPGERVILHCDPTYFPHLTECVRIELVRAGAVEICAHMLHPPGLESVRRHLRRREEGRIKELEDTAIAELFQLADIYIWLPTSWALNSGQTEKILKDWIGRSIHFHWIFEPEKMDALTFRRLSEIYELALYVDHQELSDQQLRLIELLQHSQVHITSPNGTDLRFDLRNAHFHRGNGDASKDFINSYARPGSARDREVELPAGAIRTVDVFAAEGTAMFSKANFEGREVGNLTIEFRGNQVIRLASEYHNDYVNAMWQLHSGDRDRIGEFVVGVNRALRMDPALPANIPYFGYGDGIIRISMGDNQESGGTYVSSYHQWLFLTDATVEVNSQTIIDQGRLVLPHDGGVGN